MEMLKDCLHFLTLADNPALKVEPDSVRFSPFEFVRPETLPEELKLAAFHIPLTLEPLLVMERLAVILKLVLAQRILCFR